MFMTQMFRTTDDADAFWSGVDKRGADECWPWLRSRRRYGYGGLRWRGRGAIASRVAWELFNGIPPGERSVLHRCDNPPCCNPAHLFLGTQTDNMRDMRAKGRESVQRRRIAPDRALRIAEKYDAGYSLGQIAAMCSVSIRSITNCLNRLGHKRRPASSMRNRGMRTTSILGYSRAP